MFMLIFGLLFSIGIFIGVQYGINEFDWGKRCAFSLCLA